MSEKIVVPRWFDEWYKSFYNDSVRLHYLNRVGYDSHRFLDGDNLIYAGKHDYVIKNKLKLNRAILDGYEVEEEYIEVSPVKAYERYLNDIDVYFYQEKEEDFIKISHADYFGKEWIKTFNIKFYIKEENE